MEEIEGEIMDWFYDTVKINFEVEMIQDATDLRKIIEKYLPKVYQEARKEAIEEILKYWREMGWTKNNKEILNGEECFIGTRLPVKDLLKLKENRDNIK